MNSASANDSFYLKYCPVVANLWRSVVSVAKIVLLPAFNQPIREPTIFKSLEIFILPQLDLVLAFTFGCSETAQPVLGSLGQALHFPGQA